MIVMLIIGMALGFLLNHDSRTAIVLFLTALAVELVADLIGALRK